MTKATQVKSSKPSAAASRIAPQKPSPPSRPKGIRGARLAAKPAPRPTSVARSKPAATTGSADTLGKQTIERISKQAQLISLLSQQGGTTLSAMMSATGWQAHSVRGVLSGVLRKKLGLVVSCEKVDQGERIYRIAA